LTTIIHILHICKGVFLSFLGLFLAFFLLVFGIYGRDIDGVAGGRNEYLEVSRNPIKGAAGMGRLGS
jgi:hypothetical protein